MSAARRVPVAQPADLELARRLQIRSSISRRIVRRVARSNPVSFSVAITCASPFRLTETSRVSALVPVKKSHARSACGSGAGSSRAAIADAAARLA